MQPARDFGVQEGHREEWWQSLSRSRGSFWLRRSPTISDPPMIRDTPTAAWRWMGVRRRTDLYFFFDAFFFEAFFEAFFFAAFFGALFFDAFFLDVAFLLADFLAVDFLRVVLRVVDLLAFEVDPFRALTVPPPDDHAERARAHRSARVPDSSYPARAR